jgi:hypothetical protein
MKPQIPKILSKFYDKHDPAVCKHEIQTDDLPEIDKLFRDNTTGIVWKVVAHSGADVYDAEETDYPGYHKNISLVKKQRERLVILTAVEPAGLTMHVTPQTLKTRIHSSEHFRIALKAQPQIDRFEELDALESNDAPFWRRGVKVMDTEKTLCKLAEAETTSLYVLNVYPTPHGLADLLIEYLDGNATHRTPQVAKVAATWVPQDLLASIPKDALLKSQTFRRFLDGGMIVAITKGSAKMIMETPEYEFEAERLVETQPDVKLMRARKDAI